MVGKKFQSDEHDKIIGDAILFLRKRQGLTQKDLADMLNVSFQQVQKYESAENRISASRLYKIACALQVSVADLYRFLDNSSPMHDKKMRDFILTVYRLPESDRLMLFTLAMRLGV